MLGAIDARPRWCADVQFYAIRSSYLYLSVDNSTQSCHINIRIDYCRFRISFA